MPPDGRSSSSGTTAPSSAVRWARPIRATPSTRGVHPDEASLLVTKTVNSAFYGTPDLDTWLRDQGITTIVVCGIQTNMCVETTARMSGNLGYEVIVPIDATRTFALTGPTIAGTTWSLTADALLRWCAVSLHGGGFATVTTTADVLDRLSSRERRPVWTTGHTASTDVPVETHWETYVSMLSGDLVLPGGDRFEPEGPLAVGTRIAVTPAGQETISSEITVFDAHTCAPTGPVSAVSCSTSPTPSSGTAQARASCTF